jgi:uncharacterized protein (DUF2336 family)
MAPENTAGSAKANTLLRTPSPANRLDAQPLLRPLLGDADPSVRLAAATAVLQLADSPAAQAAAR